MHIMFVSVNEAHSSIALNLHQSVHVVSNMCQPNWHDTVSCHQTSWHQCVADVETLHYCKMLHHTSQSSTT